MQAARLMSTMSTSINIGDCVRLPDGRIGRIRARQGNGYKVRVQRPSGRTHQFLVVPRNQLVMVACPDGWMSPAGYSRYLKATLSKMRQRQNAAKRKADRN